MLQILKSFAVFIVAGLCEIGGGYLIWLWLREGRPGTMAFSVLLSLPGMVLSPLTSRPASVVCTRPMEASLSHWPFSGAGKWIRWFRISMISSVGR